MCPDRLKIGIVGFGTFGQFLAKRMVQAGHEVRPGARPHGRSSRPLAPWLPAGALPVTPPLMVAPCSAPAPHMPACPRPRQVIATSRSPYHDLAASLGVKYFTDADDFCEEHPEVVVLASSILSLESVSKSVCVTRSWARRRQDGSGLPPPAQPVTAGGCDRKVIA